jgi:hypothetical protein
MATGLQLPLLKADEQLPPASVRPSLISGFTVDVLLNLRRDIAAAKGFFTRALAASCPGNNYA